MNGARDKVADVSNQMACRDRSSVRCLGALAIFRFGVPRYPTRSEAGQQMLLLENDDPDEVRAVERADLLSRLSTGCVRRDLARGGRRSLAFGTRKFSPPLVSTWVHGGAPVGGEQRGCYRPGRPTRSTSG